jgi:hypothetical protein
VKPVEVTYSEVGFFHDLGIPRTIQQDSFIKSQIMVQRDTRIARSPNKRGEIP